jgi:hypothetical protein
MRGESGMGKYISWYKIQHISPIFSFGEIKCLLAVLCGETESKWLPGIPIQSLTTAAGASSHNSYPIAQNLKVTTGHPGSRAKSLTVFFGGGGMHRMWHVRAGKLPQQVSDSSILPIHDSEEPIK